MAETRLTALARKSLSCLKSRELGARYREEAIDEHRERH